MTQLTVDSLLRAKALMDEKTVEPVAYKIKAGSEVCRKLKEECEEATKLRNTGDWAIHGVTRFHGMPVVEDHELLPWEYRLLDRNNVVLKTGFITFGIVEGGK